MLATGAQIGEVLPPRPVNVALDADRPKSDVNHKGEAAGGLPDRERPRPGLGHRGRRRPRSGSGTLPGN